MTHYLKTTLPAIVLAATTAFAQQTVPFTQFWTTQLQTNPATAGLNYKQNAYMAYSQPNGSYGAPTCAYAGYATKVARINSGAGISYSLDANRLGTEHTQSAMLHYAYQFDLGGSTLAAGVSGGALIYTVDWDKLTYGDLIAPDRSSSFQAVLSWTLK